jgi:hypothetical protein
MMMTRRIVSVIASGFLVVGLYALPARADATYHSQHIELAPIAEAQLRTGFVENIHVNGPNVYAHENYALNGADANASYQVSLSLWTANTSCSGPATLQFPTAVLTTNAAGNGTAHAVFTPEDAAGLRGQTISAMWTLSVGTSVAYTTDCEILRLD